MKRIAAIAAITAATSALLVGCGTEDQFGDSSTGAVDASPQFILLNVDGFPNIAARCIGSTLVLTTSSNHRSRVITVPVADQVGLALDGVTVGDPFCTDDGSPAEWVSQTFTGTYADPSGEGE